MPSFALVPGNAVAISKKKKKKKKLLPHGVYILSTGRVVGLVKKIITDDNTTDSKSYFSQG